LGYVCLAIGATFLVFAIPFVLRFFLVAVAGAAFAEGEFAGQVMGGVGLGFLVVVAGSLCAGAYRILKGQTENTLILVGIASLMTVGGFYTKFSTQEFFQLLYAPAFESEGRADKNNDVVAH
jgi:hypothetical protein